MDLAGNERYCAAQGQIHANPNLPVVQEGHLWGWRQRVSDESAERQACGRQP
jgi:hypothetical protein